VVYKYINLLLYHHKVCWIYHDCVHRVILYWVSSHNWTSSG